jgi:hypothetical protein
MNNSDNAERSVIDAHSSTPTRKIDFEVHAAALGAKAWTMSEPE